MYSLGPASMMMLSVLPRMQSMILACAFTFKSCMSPVVPPKPGMPPQTIIDVVNTAKVFNNRGREPCFAMFVVLRSHVAKGLFYCIEMITLAAQRCRQIWKMQRNPKRVAPCSHNKARPRTRYLPILSFSRGPARRSVIIKPQ